MFGFRKKQRVRLALKFSVVIEPDEAGFHAYCPALKGLHVDGATESEAFNNAVAAAKVYLASLSAHGDPLPVGPNLEVRGEAVPPLAEGASLRSVTVEWPTLQMSGAS